MLIDQSNYLSETIKKSVFIYLTTNGILMFHNLHMCNLACLVNSLLLGLIIASFSHYYYTFIIILITMVYILLF